MYKVTETDKSIILINGDVVKPEITFINKFDEKAQIVEYNNECVLFLANRIGTYNRTKHWPPEIQGVVNNGKVSKKPRSKTSGSDRVK